MTEALNKSQLDEIVYLYKGNKFAVKYVLDILYAGHLWDDLIDKDVERTDADINQAFRVALGDIPTNPFYQANQAHLGPLMMSAAMLWLDSVKLEKGNDNHKMAAFVMRNALMNIAHYCMLLVGGIEWVQENGERIWSILSLHDKWLEFRQE